MLETLRNALKVKEIRKRLLYTFMMLVVVRLGSQIPLPFVNGDTVKSITSQFSEGLSASSLLLQVVQWKICLFSH